LGSASFALLPNKRKNEQQQQQQKKRHKWINK
jgi:hypothetical protein